MGASPSNGTPLFRFSGRFIPISRPTPINAGRGALRRPQRLCERCVLCGPQYLITGAMTLSEMAVLAMDEILLRTEISGRGEEGLGVGRPNGPGAGAAATSAALPCGVRGISLRNGRGGRVATYRRAKAPRQGSAGPSSAGLRFVRWSSVRPLAFGRRARTRSRRGCRPRRTARPCRSRSRRPSP